MDPALVRTDWWVTKPVEQQLDERRHTRKALQKCAVTATIGIVAHTARAAQAHQLREHTRAAYMSIDNGTLGCENNHHRVWTWCTNHARRHHHDWVIVLEDDAQPITDFPDQLANALRYAPTPILSFYLGTSRPPQHQPRIRAATQQAETTGAAWITSPRLYHAVAVAIQTSHAHHMLTHLKPHIPIDENITHWARANHHIIAYTWPSLCDHHDQPTLVQHRDHKPRNQPRKAWKHGTPNWNRHTIPIHR